MRFKIVGEVIPPENAQRAWEEYHSDLCLQQFSEGVRVDVCAKVFDNYQKGLRICEKKAKNIPLIK